ncbi:MULTISPECIES: hypothetical protein [unclassified Mesorhizobium]|uniref:hypothetical protein n=1 Tax=unclassified Mesorhizobium TaxID=325217 RepID=UPI001092EBC1|nr:MULTISPECIES: hypothetical protein [unclassified Mesorhizobium]TGP93814.1 hypothetical protein EN861_17135 [Mesorhizobium sp. M8A.F.Ca.ET.218.01.1.1]TGT18111.1 hypothetical protein EN856_16665 [Mesorhizobium sp. M8A.F.Ca.ET.213.01.1.1]
MSEEPRLEHRMNRAMSVANTVWREIRDFIPHNCQHEAFDRMLNVFHQHGVEIITDRDRRDMGLPPRGPDGWTAEEIFVLEQLRLDAMMNVIVPMSSSVKISK